MKRAGLGRGLDALLPAQESPDRVQAGGGLLEVPVEAIRANPRQPRQEFDGGALEELATSVSTLGVLQPLLVRRHSERLYELIAGERRLRAAKQAGLSQVPVLVVETDDRGSLERALVENVHRQDLNPIEEATAYRELLAEGGLTHEALAERLGRSRVTISNALRLLELNVEVQRLLVDRRLSAGHGRALLALQGSPFQKRLAQRAVQEGLSVRETEDLVRRYGAIQSSSRRPASKESERPALAQEAQRRLSDRLQTRVRVEMGPRKGKIVVDFVSAGELERLVGILLGNEPGGRPTTVSLD